MKKIIVFIFSISLLSAQENSNYSPKKHALEDKRSENAAYWFIENIYNYDATSKSFDKHNELNKYIRTTFSVEPYSFYRIKDNSDKSIPIFSFTVFNNDHTTDIVCMHREKIESFVYEYWIIKKYLHYSSGFRDIIFVVTNSNSITDKRNILYKSSQFIEEINIDETQKFIFPTDVNTLFWLQPWLYPDNYEHSSLKNKIIWHLPENSLIKNKYKVDETNFAMRELTEEELNDYKKNQNSPPDPNFDVSSNIMLITLNPYFLDENILEYKDKSILGISVLAFNQKELLYNPQKINLIWEYSFIFHSKNLSLSEYSHNLSLYLIAVREISSKHFYYPLNLKLGYLNKNNIHGFRYEFGIPLLKGIINPYFSQEIYSNENINNIFGVYFRLPIMLFDL